MSGWYLPSATAAFLALSWSLVSLYSSFISASVRSVVLASVAPCPPSTGEEVLRQLHLFYRPRDPRTSPNLAWPIQLYHNFLALDNHCTYGSRFAAEPAGRGKQWASVSTAVALPLLSLL